MYLVATNVITVDTVQLASLITAFISGFLFAMIFLKRPCRDEK